MKKDCEHEYECISGGGWNVICKNCGHKKFIGFPKYVCHGNQRRCIFENGAINPYSCWSCTHYY
jgi:hypothetical protein